MKSRTPISAIIGLLVVVAFLFVDKGGAELSKYLLDIERFEPCSEYPNMESPLQNQTFLRINRTTRAFSFKTHLSRPLDENIGLKAELEKWGTRGWIQLPFMALQPDACNTFRKLLGKVWVDFTKKMGVKEPEKCPIPAGNYSLQNYMYDMSDLGFFAPFKGKFRYKAILMDVKTHKVMQCIMVVIDVTEPA